jgi:hypothetical protein
MPTRARHVSGLGARFLYDFVAPRHAAGEVAFLIVLHSRVVAKRRERDLLRAVLDFTKKRGGSPHGTIPQLAHPRGGVMTGETESWAFSLSSYPDQTRETRIGTAPPVKARSRKTAF